jgi:hypothetical protein
VFDSRAGPDHPSAASSYSAGAVVALAAGSEIPVGGGGGEIHMWCRAVRRRPARSHLAESRAADST